MSGNSQRNLSRWKRFKRWLVGGAYVKFGPARYIIEIHEGQYPRLRKFLAAALDYPLVSTIVGTIVGGLILAALLAAVGVLF